MKTRASLRRKKSNAHTYLFIGIYVLFGCVLGITISLNIRMMDTKSVTVRPETSTRQVEEPKEEQIAVPEKKNLPPTKSESTGSILQGTKILVAIAAYDFSQRVFLEEVLDGYHDVCVAGAVIDVVIHATVPYPVSLIDLWNSRFDCPDFQLTIVLKPSSIRLHLVDYHRTLFYERINQYDLFIFTEDDIKVRPSTVATYLRETRRIDKALEGNSKYKPSDFNVGIVRYEYNFPTNVIIDDKTRHVTQNVTRVYWEHSRFKRTQGGQPVPGALERMVDDPAMEGYVSMQNHHQGMFMATPALLEAWKVRPKCEFDRIRDRPGKASQPTEGTQRVWMSSHMLHGKRHCGVIQVLPMDSFGAMTVLHLPNKNYRRVGKQTNRTFSDGTEVFEMSHNELLVNAMELHIAMRGTYPMAPQRPYRGIRMIDEVDTPKDRTPLLERRMKEYTDYVSRGGVMSDDDMTKLELVEDA